MGQFGALPKEVDGVFVGGGHNSLVAATYLARSGLRVLVLEARPVLGGGMYTAEATLPLFRHNLHAHFVRWQSDSPVWRDLRIDRFGVETIFPDVQDAIVIDDRTVLMHYRDLDRSLEAIARVDRADAEAFRDLYEECQALSTAIIGPLRFAPPLPPDEASERLSRTDLGRRYLELTKQSSLDLIKDWFKSEAVRLLVGFNVAIRGYQPVMDVEGTGYATVVSLPASSQAQLIRGGSGEVARGLTAALYEAGGLAMTNAPVVDIEVSDGRARGVALEDGRVVAAKRFVASSLPAPLTLLDLVGEEHLDAALVSDLKAYRWNHDYALFGFHMALRDRPQFSLESDYPDLPMAHDIALGFHSVDDLITEIDEVRSGTVGPFRVQTTIPTVHDPTQAPPGHHVAFGWKVVPPGMQDNGELADRMVREYAGFAPNLEESILAVAGYSPSDIDETMKSMPRGDHLHGSFHPDTYGYLRPHPSLSDFRTPIDCLYHCGSSQHPGGGFSGAPGFIAAGVIAEDLDLQVWWDRPSARDIIERLK